MRSSRARPGRRAFSGGRAILTLLAVLWLVPGPAGGDEPMPKGLLWQRSGLPAVFPLQIKSPEGDGYYLTLHDPATGTPVLAAFAGGGTFFRVLVPPGRYRLHIAAGQAWQGEDALFGPGTRRLALAEELEFGVLGAGIKGGHLVTLRQDAPDGVLRAEVQRQYICQTGRIAVRVGSRTQPDFSAFRLRSTPRQRLGLHGRWAVPAGRLPERFVLEAEEDADRRFVRFGMRQLNRGPAAPPARPPVPLEGRFSLHSSVCG
ncbi:hypothetical protein [Cribrihabitans pelagius]|uniref:hypothetical protein n=1 Tax=Cribrihabitans pelagius TaxID=1765746 RepID=UPI003B5A877B